MGQYQRCPLTSTHTWAHTFTHKWEQRREGERKKENKYIYIFRIGSIIAKFPSSYRMILWLFWSTLGAVALRLTVKAESRDWRSTSENRSKVRRWCTPKHVAIHHCSWSGIHLGSNVTMQLLKTSFHQEFTIHAIGESKDDLKMANWFDNLSAQEHFRSS